MPTRPDADDISESVSQPVNANSWTPGVEFADDDADDYMEGWDGRITQVGRRAPESVGRCVICLCRFATPVQTACGHVFCLGCVKHHITSSNTAAAGIATGNGASATATGTTAASRGSAYAPGARCPVCRMPCAMSELRPAVFSEEDEQSNFVDDSAEKKDTTDVRAVNHSHGLGSHEMAAAVDDEWADAEAAWAAAEADADSNAQ